MTAETPPAPSTGRIRAAATGAQNVPVTPEQFDAWLTEHDRQAQAPLLALIRDLTDEGDCRFDHHGGCQGHGQLQLEPGEMCPHAKAKRILAGTGTDLAPDVDGAGVGGGA